MRQIDASNGVVYVTWARQGILPDRVLAALQLKMSVTPTGYRYLWIVLRKGLEPAFLPSVIGHELQHAAEVLADPTITTTGALEERFAQPLRGHAARVLETIAAVRAGQNIRRELHLK